MPPFASAMLPPLGPHVLQALAKAEAMTVRVLYANLMLASMLDMQAYEALCEMRPERPAEEAGEGAGSRTAADARTKPDLVGEATAWLAAASVSGRRRDAQQCARRDR